MNEVITVSSCRKSREQLESELREALERIKKLEKDPITEIPNRSKFEQVYAEKWDEAKKKQMPLLVISIDGDGLKNINDNLGHLAGDEYLKGIAEFLQSLFHCSEAHEETDFVARVGGDEFCIIITEGSAYLHADVAKKRILDAVKAKTVDVNDMTIALRISVGSAKGIPGIDFQSPKELLDKADEDMYRAKGRLKRKIKKFLIKIYIKKHVKKKKEL